MITIKDQKGDCLGIVHTSHTKKNASKSAYIELDIQFHCKPFISSATSLTKSTRLRTFNYFNNSEEPIFRIRSFFAWALRVKLI